MRGASRGSSSRCPWHAIKVAAPSIRNRRREAGEQPESAGMRTSISTMAEPSRAALISSGNPGRVFCRARIRLLSTSRGCRAFPD